MLCDGSGGTIHFISRNYGEVFEEWERNSSLRLEIANHLAELRH